MLTLGFPISAPLRLGVVDVGSNSTHLQVVDVGIDGEVSEIIHEREQLRLTELKDADDLLTVEALDKLSDVLKAMRLRAEQLDARVRAVGTFALRDSKNWADFCEKVRRRSGVDIEVVPGVEEARLIHLGVQSTRGMDQGAILVLDIGGGSAELVVARGPEILLSSSLKLGAVRLTRRFLNSDPLDPAEIQELREYVLERLVPICAHARRLGFECAIATGGTAKSLLALAGGLKGGTTKLAALTAPDLSQVFQAVSDARSTKERRLLPGMDAKRADVIVAGALVMDAVTRLVEVPCWSVSRAGVREGILVDTIARDVLWKNGSTEDVRWKSVRSVGSRLGLDEAHCWHVAQLSLNLFDGTFPIHGYGAEWREYLRAAAMLHEVGMFVDFTAYHKHSHYLVSNFPLAGFTLRERDIVAAIIRFHRKRPPGGSEPELQNLRENERRAVECLSAILRLAVTLDRSRQGLVRGVQVLECREGLCRLAVGRHSPSYLESHTLEAEKKPLEKSLSIRLEILLQSPFLSPS